MVQSTQKPSAYDKLPGMKDANKGSASEGGPVKQALRGLGFSEGEALLKPPAPPSGPQPPVAPIAPKTPAEETAGRIVATYGKTVEGVAQGLAAENATGDDEVKKALEAVVTKKVVTQAVLSQHLVASGRSNELGAKKGTLGGKRTKEADAKAEVGSGKVLAGMESATRENQDKTNKRKKESRPLTHAVSGHGKGSDQIGRLVHGRRADELAADKNKPSAKTLTGNTHGIGDTATPDYTTVGEDPSNTSGAFTTNLGMLHVVGEAFAQADMVDRYAEGQRRGGDKSADVDQQRLATTVKGDGRDLGYNVEATGVSGQKKGATLSKGEVDARFKSIKRTDGQMNATVVLDPSYNEKGKRVGWNLQTAYANNEAPSDSYAKPSDVGGKEHDVEARAESSKKVTKEKKAAWEEASKSLKQAQSNLVGKKKGQAAKPAAIGKAKQALATAKTQQPPMAAKDLEKLEEALAKLEKELEDINKTVTELTLNEPILTQKVAAAKLAWDKAVEDEKKAAKAANDLAATKAGKGGGGGKAPDAGYDPKTGLWTTGRPEKPDSIPSIKGTDKATGASLTAHHLYPWNKIEADLNAALGAKNRGALEKLFVFGDVKVPSTFWDELAKAPADRNYEFAEVLNHAVPKICWSPANVFMGPSERGDDPGEEVDTAYTKSGLPSPGSAAAELLAKSGGIGGGGKQSKLAAMLVRNIREGGGAEARQHDPSEWTKDKNGKPIRVNPNAVVRDETGKAKLDTNGKTTAEAPRSWKKNGQGKPVLSRG